MMNMEWSILPGYAREEEIRQLFTEYTDMVLAGDPTFAGYLARQHYEDELAHPARKYAPPHGRLYLVCTGSTPVGCAALKALDDTRCEMKRIPSPSCRRPSLFISGRASTRSSGTMITPCPVRCTSAVSCKGRFDRKIRLKIKAIT